MYQLYQPTNRFKRIDHDDVVYKTETAKIKAMAQDIKKKEKGQPVLVGTVSIEKSEHISKSLRS